jgi:hypothetical protein
MSFVKCSVQFVEDELKLFPDWTYEAEAEGTMMLLSSFTIGEAKDSLVPCFDIDELRRRNQQKLQENTRCS